MGKEYNRLTKKLLSEGYTAENHPDYVRVGNSYNKEEPLDNYDGGFIYERWWIYEKVFKTPCGLQCKGSSCHSSMSHMGIDWTFENDMAITNYPYDKKECGLKHRYLQDRGALKFNCNVHMVDDEYCYEGSCEGIRKLRDDEIRRKQISFSLQRNGRVCNNHMHYSRDTGKWEMYYDPSTCANLRCMGNADNVRCAGICPILGRELDKEKGNVYYDIKTSGRRYDLDGTLFEGQRFTNIIRGRRVFNHPVSMDICRNYVKLCKDDIEFKVRGHYHRELFFAEYHGRDFSVEVLNIRAEQRCSRDLEQDLADIKAGIEISYDDDLAKESKETKKKRRQESQERKVRKLEEKIIKTGYHNMDPYSLDRRHADKWLSMDRIAHLEEVRQQKIKEEQEKPVQLSIFDVMEKQG